MLDILNKFSTHLKNVLVAAGERAGALRHAQIEPDHLLLCLAQEKGSTGLEILTKAGFKPDAATALLLERRPPVEAPGAGVDSPTTVVPPLSPRAKHSLVRAASLAASFAHSYIGTEHLLWAIAKENEPTIQELFRRAGTAMNELEDHLTTVLKSTSKFPDIAELFERTREVDSGRENSKTPALDYFTTDLTVGEVQKAIDPVIGRATEIDRLIHILARRKKNNPVLLGDPGVGKTAIVEGLAKKVLAGDVPPVLTGKRILALDLGLVVAGTIYRGEFEGRFKQILDEIKSDPSIILFIDELHTIIGTGGAPGTLDAANILKPALSRGEIRCIGATTLEEYRKHIESDAALERRFQPIIVAEPTPAEAEAVLKGVRRHYERYHHVTITDEAIQAAVRLSTRYLQDKFLPDKALDLIDEAASKFKVSHQKREPADATHSLERDIASLEAEKRRAVGSEQYRTALELKARQAALTAKLEALRTRSRRETGRSTGAVTETEVAAVVARATGIPMEQLMSSEKTKLLKLNERLAASVLGQTDAVAAVASAIRRSRAGLSSGDRPVASFLFLGPSGVGKTELARQLAAALFEDRDALIRIDMSEFSESFNISKLIGAPAGYVGYREGAKLTDEVRRKPYAVILFDEIEKAHPDVFNLLLQVLEDGHLTDAVGKKVNFKNTVIIMTSNVGIEALSSAAGLGFAAAEGSNAARAAQERFEEIENQVLREVERQFRPEFLNRIDQTIVFRPLSQTTVRAIVELELGKLNDRLAERSIKIRVTPTAVRRIAELGFSPDVGARAIRRVIADEIEDPLAEKIIAGSVEPGQTVTIDVKKDRFSFSSRS